MDQSYAKMKVAVVKLKIKLYSLLLLNTINNTTLFKHNTVVICPILVATFKIYNLKSFS
jgi:hypothetical protein